MQSMAVTTYDVLETHLDAILEKIQALVITDANEQAAIEWRSGLRKLSKEITREKINATVELTRQIETIEEPFRALAAACKTADDDLNRKLTKHAQDRAERQRLAAQEARAQQAAALKTAAESTATAAAATGSDKLMDEAAWLERRAENVALAPVVVQRSVTTETGAKSVLVTRWTYEIVAGSDVPRQFCLPDRGLIRAEVHRLKKTGVGIDAVHIPGVRVFEQSSTTIKDGGNDGW